MPSGRHHHLWLHPHLEFNQGHLVPCYRHYILHDLAHESLGSQLPPDPSFPVGPRLSRLYSVQLILHLRFMTYIIIYNVYICIYEFHHPPPTKDFIQNVHCAYDSGLQKSTMLAHCQKHSVPEEERKKNGSRNRSCLSHVVKHAESWKRHRSVNGSCLWHVKTHDPGRKNGRSIEEQTEAAKK